MKKRLTKPIQFLLSWLLLGCPVILLAQTTVTEEVNLTQHSAADRYPSYSPDGKKVVFESDRSGNWDVFVMDANGTHVRQLTTHVGEDRRPTWHPKGKKLLFESNRGGKNELYTVQVKSQKVRRIKRYIPEAELVFAEFSPNRKHIAVCEKASKEVTNLILLDQKGRRIKALTQAPKRSYYSKWSPDSQEILYFSRKETSNQDDEIYRLNVATGSERRLTNWPKHNFCPAWSPDGKQIAFVTSMEDTRPELYLMDADGSHPTRLTYNEEGDTEPAWSPDGQKLIITAFRAGNYEICELHLK